MATDIHANFIPTSLVEAAESGRPLLGVTMSRTDTGALIGHGPGGVFDLPEWTASSDTLDIRLATLDRLGLDRQVLAVAPRLHRYGEDAGHAVAFARRMNDDLADWTAASDGRLCGLVHLPLQDPAASVAELERMSGKPGIVGAAVGNNVNGNAWDSPALFPVLQAAQDLDLLYRTIEQLPPKCRRVFLLSRFHDMSYPEIARHCGISVKMVEKHIGNALAVCAERLERAESVVAT